MATSSNSQLLEKEGSDGSILCANNCGFFGCSETMNLCSVCYKLLMKKQNNAKAEEDASMKLLMGNQCKRLRDTATGEEEEEGEGQKSNANQCKRSRDTATGEEEEGGEGEKSNAKKLKPNRCSCCKKRVGLTGFHCRCGETFCGLHRYAEEHNCPYDYRKAAQQSIAKNNPVIKAEKFQKF